MGNVYRCVSTQTTKLTIFKKKDIIYDSRPTSEKVLKYIKKILLYQATHDTLYGDI